MTIKKYKYLGGSKYKLFIDEEEYIIYEDIIVKNEILLKTEISKEELDKYLKQNEYYEALYKTIKYIGIKMRCKKEIKKYLEKTYNKKITHDIIKHLENNNYINEVDYAKAYINDQINLKTSGPYKIEKELTNLEIDKNIIFDCLKIYTKEIELEKINKYINKEVKINKTKSLSMLKNKILYSLTNLGFTKEYIVSCLDNIKFDEEDIYKKEYEKLYKKLSTKYKGAELEFKIKQKMYSKGFKY